jgi:hypothetical protein
MKPKELEWEKELEKLSEQYSDYFTAVALDDVKKLIPKLLTQQRAELLKEILREIDNLSMPVGRNELENLINNLNKPDKSVQDKQTRKNNAKITQDKLGDEFTKFCETQGLKVVTVK